jgi:hypothetical protein
MHRLGIPVRDRNGDVRAVEAYVRTDTVELWLLGRLRGVFDREELRTWLAAQHRNPLECDEVTWSTGPDGEIQLRVAQWVPDTALTDRTVRWLLADPA